jgi:hypothetical protein
VVREQRLHHLWPVAPWVQQKEMTSRPQNGLSASADLEQLASEMVRNEQR